MSPGDGVLAPWGLAAVVVLLVNDHFLKGSGLLPGFVTGKLSDVAGLLFFPVLVEGLIEVAASRFRPWRGPSRHLLLACVLATGAGFAALQMIPMAADAYRWGLGLLQAPFRALLAGGELRWRAVAVWPDPTDLLCLPVLLLSWRWGQLRGLARSPRGAPSETV